LGYYRRILSSGTYKYDRLLHKDIPWAYVKARLPDHPDQQKCKPKKEWAITAILC